MSLTQQFLIISLLPLSFISMAVYVWQARVPRKAVSRRWTITLLFAALWSSNVLRYYGGVSFAANLVFTWGIVANYLFGLMTLGTLLTMLSHLKTAAAQGRIAVTLSVILWLVALGLDPAVWPYRIAGIELAGQAIRHFDLWVAVWIASWLLPTIAAWIVAQQANAGSPTSLYRNQIRYWLLLLTLLVAGGGLASIRQPGQPAWQEGSVLLITLAALIGTFSITSRQLPDLQLVTRRILSRLSGSLIVFGLTWAAMRFLVQVVTDLPADTSPDLILTLAAALFAGLFTLVYRLVNDLTSRLFVPALVKDRPVASIYGNVVENLSEPDKLGQQFLHVIQSNLAVDDAWLLTTEAGRKGTLTLRPLASLEGEPPPAADFDGDSPFIALLRRQTAPIVQYDIELLAEFDEMRSQERSTLANWHRQLYVPLKAGDRLVGVIALAEKYTGEAFERADFEELGSLARQISPLLAQAQQLSSLQQVNDYVLDQNQLLAQKLQYLSQLSRLYAKFISLITPELRRPFASIRQQIHQLQEAADLDSRGPELTEKLSQQLEQARSPIEQLINVSNQIQQPDDLELQEVHFESIVEEAVRKLRVMAEARQVIVQPETAMNLPPLLGDADKLREAVQHLLHNAIKFNKIGGTVQLNYTVSDSHLSLHVIDSGVGVPPERLDTLWTSLGNIYDDPTQGSGLGLALTHFIIAAHGGHITVESSHGTGSTFSIHLPLLLAEDTAA